MRFVYKNKIQKQRDNQKKRVNICISLQKGTDIHAKILFFFMFFKNSKFI